MVRRGGVGERLKNVTVWLFGPEGGTLGLTNNHTVEAMNRSLWLVQLPVPVCQQRAPE